MIDLNDVWQPSARFDLGEVRERLSATAADWLPSLFPHAHRSSDRKTLRCADLSGRAPRNEGSCVIHLKGARAGRARISERHANFIVNEGGARAAVVKALIELAQRVVWERSGVWLEPEVRLVGIW